MKVLAIILMSLIPYFSFAQEQNFQEILDSGKSEFKRQFYEYYPDYSKASGLLKQAASLKPDNAEARYFFGYVLDKMNSINGLDSVDLDLTLKVSEQFEAVNKLQPQYKGEYMLLDPYSKLSANWGSLAFHYLTKAKKDSAIWALKEGKKRGGFIDGMLEYNKQLLSGCEKNSILIGSGDNVTFSCTYLQLVEKFRTDITFVDRNLLGTDWYRNLLKKEKTVNTDYGIEIDDSAEYLLWETDTIKIADPKGKNKSLIWELKPTYQGALLTWDLSLLGILKRNFFERSIYFLADSDSASHLFLDGHLLHDGFLLKLTSDNITEDNPYKVTANFNKYSVMNVDGKELDNSLDLMRAFDGLRLSNLIVINFLVNRNQKEEARKLFIDMDKRFPLNKLMLSSNDMIEYYNSIKSSLGLH